MGSLRRLPRRRKIAFLARLVKSRKSVEGLNDYADFMSRMGGVYSWCSPEVVGDLTEAQIYGYSSRIAAVEKERTEYEAAVLADRLAVNLAALLFGGKGK